MPLLQMKYYRPLFSSYLKKLLCIGACLGLLLGFKVPAYAYILPGPFLLKLMTQHLGTAKRLWVNQKLIFYNDNPQTSAIELSEDIKYIFPAIFRSDISSENIQKIHVFSRGNILTIMDGKVSDEPESSYEDYKDLFLFRSREQLQERLSRLGVDVKVSSFGRFQGQPAYVVGAQYPDETHSQIWLDKNTFRPFRWIMASNANQNLEVRYLKWNKFQAIWYPMHIEFISNDKLVREIHVQNIKVNPSFSKKLFDIEYLKLHYPRTKPNVSVDKNNKANQNEIQKTIEDFIKIYK